MSREVTELFKFTTVSRDDLQNSFLTLQKTLLIISSSEAGFKSKTSQMGAASFFYEIDKLPTLAFNKLRDSEQALKDPVEFGVRPYVVVPPEPDIPANNASQNFLTLFMIKKDEYDKAKMKAKALKNVVALIANAMRKALEGHHPDLANLGLDINGMKHPYISPHQQRHCLG
jgi:hypothetical protein